MSLEEKRKKIDEEYVHFVVKLKNSLALKRDTEILDKLGLKFEEVCGFKFCVHGFPNSVPYISPILINYIVYYLKS